MIRRRGSARSASRKSTGCRGAFCSRFCCGHALNASFEPFAIAKEGTLLRGLLLGGGRRLLLGGAFPPLERNDVRASGAPGRRVLEQHQCVSFLPAQLTACSTRQVQQSSTRQAVYSIAEAFFLLKKVVSYRTANPVDVRTLQYSNRSTAE